MKKSGVLTCVVLTVCLNLASCKPITTLTELDASPSPSPAGGLSRCLVGATPCNDLVCVSKPADQAMHLNGSATFTLTVTAGSNYSGNLVLSLGRDELNALDPPGVQTVTTVLSKTAMALGPNCSDTVTLGVVGDTRAPAGAQHVHVVATDTRNAGIKGENSVDIMIEPKLRIGIYGRQLASQPTFQNWDAPFVSLVRNSANVSLFFDNHDTNLSHVVHVTSNQLAHQGNAGAPSPASLAPALAGGIVTPTMGAVSGTYPGLEADSPPMLDGSSITFYLHNEEAAGNGTNANPGSQRVARSVADDASNLGNLVPTYTGVIRPMLLRSCLICHSAGGAAPFELTTQQQAIDRILPIIQRVSLPEGAPGVMPPPSTVGDPNPPHLSAQDIKYLKEWQATGFQ